MTPHRAHTYTYILYYIIYVHIYLGILGERVDRVGEDDDLVPALLVVAHQVLADPELVGVPV